MSTSLAAMNWTVIMQQTLEMVMSFQDEQSGDGQLFPGLDVDMQAIWDNVNKIMDMMSQGETLEDSLE